MSTFIPSKKNKITPSKDMETFWYYIIERHQIYKKKTLQKLPAPWTEDKILQKWKFTNVFRDLDPGTKFVTERICKECDSFPDFIFNCIIYRIYNRVSTMESCGFPFSLEKFDKDKFLEALKYQRDVKKESLFTNAFMVSAFINWKHLEKDKAIRSAECVYEISQKLKKTNMLAEMKEYSGSYEDSKKTFENMKSFDGIGNFLGYQIAVDIGYRYPRVFNEDLFTVAGPGCIKGLERIFKKSAFKEEKSKMYEYLISWLVEHQEEYFKKNKVDPDELFDDRKLPRLNIMAMENCLCEISKYIKVKKGQGKCRNAYNGLGEGVSDKKSRKKATKKTKKKASPKKAKKASPKKKASTKKAKKASPKKKASSKKTSPKKASTKKKASPAKKKKASPKAKARKKATKAKGKSSKKKKATAKRGVKRKASPVKKKAKKTKQKSTSKKKKSKK